MMNVFSYFFTIEALLYCAKRVQNSSTERFKGLIESDLHYPLLNFHEETPPLSKRVALCGDAERKCSKLGSKTYKQVPENNACVKC